MNSYDGRVCSAKTFGIEFRKFSGGFFWDREFFRWKDCISIAIVGEGAEVFLTFSHGYSTFKMVTQFNDPREGRESYEKWVDLWRLGS